jgi:hypothetical protein
MSGHRPVSPWVRKILWILVNEKTKEIKHFEQVNWEPVPYTFTDINAAILHRFKEVSSGVGHSLIAGRNADESLVDSEKIH